jgi:ketosteroid isomerase-like protein
MAAMNEAVGFSIDPAVAEAVLAADDARAAAGVRNDLDAMARLLADDFIFVHAADRIDSKESYLAELRAGIQVYKALTRTAVVAMSGTDVVTLVYDLVTERVRNGKAGTFRSRAMSTWRQGADGWTLKAYCTVPKP